MKMTFQPKKRSRAKVHGFRARISSQKIKRKKAVISVGRIFVAFSSRLL